MTNDKQTDRPSPRMPVRRNGLATKARLIDAAITLIGAGEDNLTMRSLSAEASCSPAAVYQFFSDMNHVLESVSEVIVEEVTTYLGKRLTPTLALQDPILFFFELIRCVEVLQRKRPATMCLAKPAATQASQMLALSLRTAVFELVCDAFQTAYPHVDRGRHRKILSVAQSGILGAVSGLPPRRHPEREDYLRLIADLAGGFVSRNLLI